MLFPAMHAHAQSNQARPLITQAVDESKLTVLKGNTHPLARAEFDKGAAAPSMPMEHLMLVLKRGPVQEAALEKLVAEQQDKSSPNYHKWLTPQQFGQQYGPSDQDVQAVAAWLESHGLAVVKVSNGRTVIEFSGTAVQVAQTFHTEIHNYTVHGVQHFAKLTRPSDSHGTHSCRGRRRGAT